MGGWLGGPSVLGMFIVVTTLYWFGIVGLSTFGFDKQVRACWGVNLHWVCPYLSICYTGLV